jgi:nitroreductase
METIKCIKTRRSRRVFLNKDIPEKTIKKLIECALNAPSSMNCQPWHFLIVKNKEAKIKLSKLKEEDNQNHILSAPISIVVCVDMNKSPSRWIEDGITATENILLAVHDLGLGAVYVTGFKESKPEIAEEIRKILNLPKNIIPITILPIGYPDPNEKQEHKKLVEVEEVIHYDKW